LIPNDFENDFIKELAVIEEAFIWLPAIPEEYLFNIVETLQIVNGLKNLKCRH
jgi:hypothetical protein